jgi:periplasmic protein TonB
MITAVPFRNKPLPRRGVPLDVPAATIVREIEDLLADGDSLPPGVRTRLESLHESALELLNASHPVIDLKQAKRLVASRMDSFRAGIHGIGAVAARSGREGLHALSRRIAKLKPTPRLPRLAEPVDDSGPTMFQGIEHTGRRFSGGLASGLLHCAIVALLLTISPALFRQATALHRSLIYLAPPVELTPPLQTPKPLPAPRPTETPVTFTPRTPAREAPKPVIEPPPVLAANPPRPAAIAAPKIAAAPPPPPVQTNLFRQLNAELVPQSSPVPVREAGFDHKANLVVPPGSPSAAVITRTGFDQPGNASSAVQTGSVQTGRFSSGHEAGIAAAGTGSVKRTGAFDLASAAAPVIQGSAARTSFDRPPASASASEKTVAAAILPRKSVEILDKPKPRYTDEARKAKIEGTVFLEVTFTAGGQIQVHRVVKGLAYGLDQTAIEAAQQIRFKPATLNGAPVDQTAIVQVLFQISE